MNQIITIDQMKDLSIDEIINLYKLGYRLEDDIYKNICQPIGKTLNYQTTSQIITLDQMKDLSIDEIINLYKLGYRLEDNNDVNLNLNLNLKNIINLVNPIVDPVVNFGKVTVSTGYDELATTIVLTIGNGSILPDPYIGHYNLVWWNSTDYPDPSDDPNKEIVRCTALSGDTLTITRAQEGTISSTKNTSGKIYNMVLSITAKTITDLQNDAQSKVNTHAILTSTHGVAGNIVGTSDNQSLTNKTIIDPTNNVTANSLKSSTSVIDVSGASTPSTGQVLTAISPTAATWQSIQPTCFFVSIAASPTSGTFPLSVSFNSTVIGGTDPYTYLWAFGDGGISTSPAPIHAYAINGTYTARLTVTDSIGNTTSSATTITVLTGFGIVANGLGVSESIILPEAIVMYNTGPLMLDSLIITDSLAGINNSSANAGSPFLENILRDESLIMISSLSIPATASVARNSSITLVPTCSFYGNLVTCPSLIWTSSNTNRATVSSTGVVTTSNSPGTVNITASSGSIQSICVVTVT